MYIWKHGIRKQFRFLITYTVKAHIKKLKMAHKLSTWFYIINYTVKVNKHTRTNRKQHINKLSTRETIRESELPHLPNNLFPDTLGRKTPRRGKTSLKGT